jgi:hypothetical protein
MPHAPARCGQARELGFGIVPDSVKHGTMLPILRVLPVGGVLLAIFILFLALSPPDGPRAPLNTAMVPARGALVDVGHHPETRQFLIQAAIKRADELNRLRELPDTPTRTAPAEPVAIDPAPAAPAADEPKIAVLPTDRTESDPEPEEPAATETPNVRIPVETGEMSVPELPTARPGTHSTDGKPELAKEQTKSEAKPQQREIRRRVANRPRRARATTSVPQRPMNLFEALFSGQQNRNPQTPGTQQTAQGQYQAQYQRPGYSAQSAQGQYQQPAYNYQLQAPTEPYPMLRQQWY